MGISYNFIYTKLWALNGYTSETYESLHKNYVKQPYRLSNKNNIEEQLMQAVCITILKNNKSN